MGLYSNHSDCMADWVQVAFLFSLSVILYLILFAGVFVDTVLDMTRENVLLILLYREENMKMKNNDYIQLPPLKKDTSDVVAYMKDRRIQEKS